MASLRPTAHELGMAVSARYLASSRAKPVPVQKRRPPVLHRLGLAATEAVGRGIGLLGFVGQLAVAFAGSLVRPSRLRLRPILYNLRSAGFDALRRL
jgi:phospholipid/cholesterol/gamma-HCH transport system permease protein